MISKFKSILKSNKVILNTYEYFFQRDIINLFSSSCSQRVLISYSTYHFNKKSYTSHSNYQESKVIADIFNRMGYQVDVTNNNKITKLDLSQYDVIFGEGLPLYQALEYDTKAIKIYYGTGSHPFHCTQSSYSRLIDFHKKNKFLAASSLRVSDARWGVAASLADAVICIGNENTKKTFLLNGSKNVHTITPTFHKREDSESIGKSRDFKTCRKTMLWFGSYGLLHKGLDLAVEAIKKNPEWTLHICGYTPTEKEFLDALSLPINAIVHGFIDVYSDEFKALASECCFVLLPSCSEGTATAVITAIGNGAMLPIVTKECGYDVNTEGFIIELSVESIESELKKINKMSVQELKELSLQGQHAAIKKYTLENFKLQMEANIRAVLDTELN